MVGRSLGIFLLSVATLSTRAEEPPPLRVTVQVPRKTYYVGQAIELRVGAEGEGERPVVETPVVAGARVAFIDTALNPIAATGIGGMTTERNLFITRYRLIPQRAGLLHIAPVRARIGTRSAASPPLSVEVRAVPVAGRPPEFLGGVGALTVEAEAQPTTLRVGQALTYALRVEGPAARGMTGRPALDRFAQAPLGLKVEPLPDEATDSPPSRTFRYQVRPTRAGSASLPPVSIAAFDPQVVRYLTRVTSSIPIRVIDVPKLDPASLDYRPSVAQGMPSHAREMGDHGRAWALVAIALGSLAVIASLLVEWTRRNRARGDPRRQLVRRARALDPREGAGALARRIHDALADYLERTSERPRGVLTPADTCAAIAAHTRDDDLAARVARLVDDCDRARYSGREPLAADLVTEAQRLFGEIARASSPGAQGLLARTQREEGTR